MSFTVSGKKDGARLSRRIGWTGRSQIRGTRPSSVCVRRLRADGTTAFESWKLQCGVIPTNKKPKLHSNTNSKGCWGTEQRHPKREPIFRKTTTPHSAYASTNAKARFSPEAGFA